MKQKQQSKKAHSNVKLAFLALGIIILLVFLAKFLGAIISLWQPLGINITKTEHYSLNSDISANIVFLSLGADTNNKISLVNFDPKGGRASVLHLSDQIYMDLPKGMGQWRVGSIFQLGQEEEPQVGAKLLKMSLTKLLGMPVDRIVITSNNKPIEDLILEWRKNPFNILPFVSSSKSDLTKLEVMKLSWDMSRVRSDKITSLDFARSNITDSKLLPDSSRVLGVNTVALDVFIRENLADKSLSDESISVAIFNGTEVPGLASEIGRIVTNMGGNVVTMANTANLQAKTSVFTKDKDTKESLTLNRLQQFLAPNCLNKDCTVSDIRVDSSRAQINIVLGEDYYNLWYKR